ncbi:TatD family hydrolase [Candidatus Magnetaquicoccus inordinatus]|uniref:TatD family hydrolase n=1 Tax=Candidatus Magnetaquicoccus inordinatus TaxID=2496818 RepID=UPI00102BCB9A|nr:TatD family hydrolase [Candidatus Magnetaquicoccus inordinatus]
MIDTHCHLDHPSFAADRALVLQRSIDAGIRQWIIPAIVLRHFSAMQALQTAHIHLAWGLHPLFYAEHPEDALNQLAEWLSHTPPLAIGEIGLDGFAPPASQDQQMHLFCGQLAMAQSLRLPVLLHVRKCHEEVLGVLKKSAFAYGGVVHAYSGSWQQAERYLERGFCLGIGGVVTRPQATRLREIVSRVADHALVLESDAPDLPPVACSGQRNEPAFIRHTVATLAQLRNCSADSIAESTTANARRILSLHPSNHMPPQE